jgi:DNA-binding NtrC family response regulator
VLACSGSSRVRVTKPETELGPDRVRVATLGTVGGETTTVLVVDDDPSLRLLCRVNLELEGYAVVEAGSIGEAERALDNGWVDVVLLDLHLGHEDGSSLVPKLEQRGLASSVALLTGSPGNRLPEGAMVIPKPFAIDDLTGTVRRLANP